MKNGNKRLLVGVVTLGLSLGSVANNTANWVVTVILMSACVGGEPALVCSEALIAPTVVLTAEHCTSGEGADVSGRIWFEPSVSDPNFPI